MGTTAKGLRYPDITDRVADGALAIEHLAEDVDAKLGQPHRLAAVAATDTILRLDAVAGQSGDLLEAWDAAGNEQVRVSSSGTTILGPGLIASPALPGVQNLALLGRVTNNLMLYLRRFAGMTSDMIRVDDEAGVNLLAVDKNGHLCGRGTAPTLAAGTALGTAPPAATITGNDQGGLIKFGTGTAPAAGPSTALTVTFNRPYASAPAAVVLTPATSATVPVGLYVPYTAIAAASFNVNVPSAALAASQAATTYAFFYSVIGA